MRSGATSALACFDSDQHARRFAQNIGLAALPAVHGPWATAEAIKGPHALRNLGNRRFVLLDAPDEVALRLGPAIVLNPG